MLLGRVIETVVPSMLVDELSERDGQGPEGLRLTLLSGDWIALALPEQITHRWPNARRA